MSAIRGGIVAFLVALPILLGPTAASARPDVSPNIIGGEPADREYSFMASLQDLAGNHFCGGALIRADLVVTAAHCIAGKAPGSIQLRIGSLDRAAGGALRWAASTNPHPSFFHSNGYDIALIRLTEPVHDFVPVPIYADRYFAPGSSVILPVRMLGWGQDDCHTPGCDLDGPPVRLNQISGTASAYGYRSWCRGTNLSTDLCVRQVVNAGPCYGDSGGPALYWLPDTNSYALVGVTSRAGNSGGRCGGSTIYTNVTAFADWLDG